MSITTTPSTPKLKTGVSRYRSTTWARQALKASVLLCLTASAQGSEIVFADVLVTKKTPAQLIHGSGEYQFSDEQPLERGLNPYGLYLTLNRQESLEDNGSRQSLGLEWELFEDGWYEKKKRLNQLKMQTAIGELQRKRDIAGYNEAAVSAYLNSVTLTVKHFYAEKLLNLIAPLVARRKSQMDNGFATITDVSDMELKLRKAQLQLQQTQQSQPVKLSADYAQLGNTISAKALNPSAELCSAVDRLPAVSVHDAFANLSETEHSYWEDVDLSIFMEYRDIQRQDAQLNNSDVILEGYVAGIDLKLPLFTAKAAQKESKTRSAQHRYNKIDTMTAMENSCQGAIRKFYFAQEQVLVLEAEYENLVLRRKSAERKSQADLPGHEKNYEREVELLDYLILLKEEQVLVSRVQALAHLIKISRYHPSGELSSLLAIP